MSITKVEETKNKTQKKLEALCILKNKDLR